MRTNNTNSNTILLAHHAYVVEGGAKMREALFKILESSWQITTKGNPDFSYQKFETLKIEEARKLKELQENKAFSMGGKKIFVIEAGSITAEAQNSLLKIFEEPTENTHFFLIGNCVKNLIPTLVSRVVKIREEDTPPSDADGGVGKEFIALTISKRLAFVKKLADDIKDEKKTRADALVLLQKIETVLYEKVEKKEKLPQKLFEDLEMCRDYISDRSGSVKMLLEYIALVTPHNS